MKDEKYSGELRSMRKQDQKLKALQQQVSAALDGQGFSPELIEQIAAHSRKRREEGRTLEFVADELCVDTWQLADWSHHKAAHNQGRQRSETGNQAKTLTLILHLRSTRRLERMLSQEIARAMQQCGSCCWEQLLDSLPGEFGAARKAVKS